MLENCEEECAGLFGPCFNDVTHYLSDPDGLKDGVPLCDEHWEWTMKLEAELKASPEFAKNFEKAIDIVIAGVEQ
jgi:hypothetical protein